MKPHTNIYIRLAKSKYGIGVFAIIDIPKGTNICYGDTNTKTVQLSEKEVSKLSKPIQKLYKDFCPLNNGIYGCPVSFNMLTPSWYLNHSNKPNCEIDDSFNFITKRRIRSGEELTVDYNTYSEKPKGEPV